MTPTTTTTTTPPTTTPPPVSPPVDERAHESSGAAAWVLLAVLCGLPAGLFFRARRRKGLKFLKAHVTVAPRPGTEAGVVVTRPDDTSDRDHVLSVVATEISRSTTVEEIRP